MKNSGFKPKYPSYRRAPVPQETAIMDTRALLNSSQTMAVFWILAAAALGYSFYNFNDYAGETHLAYLLITVSALIPFGIWAKGISPGIPIYPCFAGFQYMTFALPLLSEHPGITYFAPSDHLHASFTISLALCCGTVAWKLVGDRSSSPPTSCRQLSTISGDRILLAFIFLALLFAANTVVPWVNIPGGLFSILRGIIGGISTLAIFILGQHMGAGKLSRRSAVIYVILIGSLFVVQTATLLLINALTVAVLSVGGYTLGSRRPPWIAVALVITVITFFHIGKAPVREAYWGENRESPIRSISDVAGMYTLWIDSSLTVIQEGTSTGEVQQKKASTFQRSSLMHLLLFAQDLTSHGYPYIGGETYTLIPSLLIPRLINPDKAWSQEGTTLINIHYGLQTRESSMSTTIGWGLLNEGYANFGLAGSCAIAILIGFVTGWASLFSQGLPFLSFRSLLAILLVSATFQTEFSLGVLVTSLFQSFVGLVAFSLIFMKNLPTEELIRWVQVVPRETSKKRRLSV